MQSTIDSFDDLANFADYFSDDLGFAFRGHANSSWLLETTLDRLLKKLKPEGINLNSTHEFHLKNFVRAIRGRTPISKAITDDKDVLWALGQHYGLATPLLDWSRSLYVALYFAFADPAVPSSGFRSIWAVHEGGIRPAMVRFNAGRKYEEQFDFIDPVTDHINRLVSQVGIFTRQPLEFDLPHWIKTEFAGSADAYLFRIDIPDGERLRILKHLRQMNIHSGTLFPDLLGASIYCNETLELLADKHKKSLSRLDAVQLGGR